MNKCFGWSCLILILTLNCSCIEKKPAAAETDKPSLTQLPKLDTFRFSSGTRSIFQDSNGNYWIGTNGQGVCLFDGTSFAYFSAQEGLSGNQIRSIQEDKYGNIWFGTGSGVSSYDGKGIAKYTATDYDPNLEWDDSGNYLWFNAGTSPGVELFDGRGLRYVPLPIPNNENTYDSYGVTGISKDKDGQVWIATYSALFSFNGKSITLLDSSQLGLKANEKLHIRSVFADSKGRIWIGNNGIGVLLHDGESTINFSEINGLIHDNSPKNGDRSPAGTLEHVFSIEEDSQGNIWFGDRDTGAWKYDGVSMTNYIIDKQLKTQMIWDIHKDQNNNLLFAMADGGIYEFDGKSFYKKF
ncbi:MAG: two-component regulator propeller domain-containing protein [Bacteroidota bacterium]